VANGVVYVTDQNANLTAYTLPVTTATLAANPGSGSPFQTVAVSGANFGASETVKVFWDNGATPLATPTTAADGSFAANVVVPQAPAGMHTLTAVGQTSGKTAPAAFQVKPAIYVFPSTGKAGSVAYLVGVGFGSSETVAGLWYPGFGVLNAATSNAAGTVAVAFLVPAGAAGAHYVIGDGLSSKVAASVPFTVTAP
jgi:hypothetical protein